MNHTSRNNLNVDTALVSTNPGGVSTSSQQNDQTLEMDSISRLTQTEESSSQIFDAIALSGPPPYNEVFNVLEVPPPTYEQATRASTENLS